MENNYGIYSWANAIINYARLIVDYGFVIYGVEAVARCKDDKEEISIVVTNIIKYKMILCVLTGVALSILCAFVPQFHEYAFMIMAAYLPVIVSVFGIDYVFQGMEQMKYITIRVVITRTVFTILVFLCVTKPEDYVFVPVLTAVGDLLAVIMMWHTAKGNGIHIVKSRLKERIDLLKKSTWYFFSRIFGATYSYGNTILLGLFVSKSQVAQFSVAYTLIAVAQNFITPIADSLYPYMIKNKDYKMVKRILFIFEPLIIAACLVGVFIAKPVVTLVFGTQYVEASKVVCYMLPSILIALPGCLFGFPVLSSLGLYKETNFAIILGAIFHMTGWGILLATNQVSIYHVAILTCCTEFFVVLVRGFFILKENYYKP
jgi:PST family polysaccharide transporter